MIPTMKHPLENRTNFNAPVGRNLYLAMIAPPLNPPTAPAKADTRPGEINHDNSTGEVEKAYFPG